jgi:hypothetical protein
MISAYNIKRILALFLEGVAKFLYPEYGKVYKSNLKIKKGTIIYKILLFNKQL